MYIYIWMNIYNITPINDVNIVLELSFNNLVLVQTSKSILKQIEVTIMSPIWPFSLDEITFGWDNIVFRTWYWPQCCYMLHSYIC